MMRKVNIELPGPNGGKVQGGQKKQLQATTLCSFETIFLSSWSHMHETYGWINVNTIWHLTDFDLNSKALARASSSPPTKQRN